MKRLYAWFVRTYTFQPLKWPKRWPVFVSVAPCDIGSWPGDFK